MNSSKLYVFILCIALVGSCSQREKPDSNVSDSSWALLPFSKVDSLNPILSAGQGKFMCPVLKKEILWEEKDVFNPAAVVRSDTVFLLYRAEDKIGKFAGTSRLGLAFSTDGLHFVRKQEPILFPADDFMKIYEWEGGIEDPRIVEREDGIYIMTYTAYDGNLARLCIASSKDLVSWTKHGTMLDGKYLNHWSKSGAIVANRVADKIIAKKVNGKYWMYFGDTNLFLATSDDLIHWQPVEEEGNLKPVLMPRKNHFDSRLVESGPYALITESGILLIYNGMNDDIEGDSSLAKGAYCAGQALFDGSDPSHMVSRLEENFLRPDQPYEISGQINRVCFVEGLVPFHGTWFLYFGTADSKIAVATSPMRKVE